MKIDREIQKKEALRDDVRDELARIAEAYRRDRETLLEREATLTKELGVLRHERAVERGIDPRRQAGRHYGAALGVLQDSAVPLSRVEIGSRGGIPSGTLTHAMKALEADGLVVKTGRREGRSDVFRLTPKARRGVSGLTRRRPGS